MAHPHDHPHFDHAYARRKDREIEASFSRDNVLADYPFDLRITLKCESIGVECSMEDFKYALLQKKADDETKPDDDESTMASTGC